MICVLPITSKKSQLQNTLPWIFHFSNTGGFTQGDKEGKIYELKKQNQVRLLKLWWLWCVLFIKVADVSPIHFRNQAATDGTKPQDLNIGETPRVWRREIQGQIFCLLADPGNLGVFSLCMEWSGQSKIGVVCVNDGIWQWNFETTKPNHSSWMCETVNLLQYLKTHKDETVTFQMFHVYKCLKQAVIVLVCGFFWYRYLPWYTFIYLYIYICMSMYAYDCVLWDIIWCHT